MSPEFISSFSRLTKVLSSLLGIVVVKGVKIVVMVDSFDSKCDTKLIFFLKTNYKFGK